MAAHACPMAEWLAGAVPVLALIRNAGKVNGLATIENGESQPLPTYTPKKQAVCLKFRR